MLNRLAAALLAALLLTVALSTPTPAAAVGPSQRLYVHDVTDAWLAITYPGADPTEIDPQPPAQLPDGVPRFRWSYIATAVESGADGVPTLWALYVYHRGRLLDWPNGCGVDYYSHLEPTRDGRRAQRAARHAAQWWLHNRRDGFAVQTPCRHHPKVIHPLNAWDVTAAVDAADARYATYGVPPRRLPATMPAHRWSYIAHPYADGYVQFEIFVYHRGLILTRPPGHGKYQYRTGAHALGWMATRAARMAAAEWLADRRGRR